MKPAKDTLWGVVKENKETVTFSRDYLHWLASYLDESCNCGPHLDHADCIAEAQAFVLTFGHKLGA
jgi:hypothetical protein